MSPNTNWLPLAEYSMKHQVSISTLRRRIKAEDIQYRFDEGKYLILDDEATQVNAGEHRPSLRVDVHTKPAPHLMLNAQPGPSSGYEANAAAPPARMASQIAQHQSTAIAASPAPPTEASESVITAANRLLTDLKKAYTSVLHEKENQIQALKQELADVNTLVKVLEFENEKLRNYNR